MKFFSFFFLWVWVFVVGVCVGGGNQCFIFMSVHTYVILDPHKKMCFVVLAAAVAAAAAAAAAVWGRCFFVGLKD